MEEVEELRGKGGVWMGVMVVGEERVREVNGVGGRVKG